MREIDLLPRVQVRRPPAHALLDAGMVAYDCHANCSAQEHNDPHKRFRHVVGWMVYGPDLILHSVVSTGQSWICLTPQLLAASSEFDFVPDPAIVWRDEPDGERAAYRGARRVPQALRRFPEHHIKMRDKFRELIGQGMPALDARALVDTTLGAEMRAMAAPGRQTK